METYKKIAAVIIAGVIIAIAYYGTYLPWQKSKLFIAALRDSRQGQSFEGFKEVFSVPLDFFSPVGHEEVVRNITNSIVGIIQQHGQNPAIVEESFGFIATYYEPIIERGKGTSYSQNLYLLGIANEFALRNTGEIRYLEAAKRYFELGHEAGPKRPQFLYGLFDVYRIEGNVEKVKTIAEQIFAQWPDDERTREIYEAYVAEMEQKGLTNGG